MDLKTAEKAAILLQQIKEARSFRKHYHITDRNGNDNFGTDENSVLSRYAKNAGDKALDEHIEDLNKQLDNLSC